MPQVDGAEPPDAPEPLLRYPDEHQRCFFRDQFREARAEAHRNVEEFHGLLFAIEKLGAFLKKGEGRKGLGAYRGAIMALAQGNGPMRGSPLAKDSTPGNGYLIPFKTLYEMVRCARNDALHQGAFARHLTTHATELAIVLEDALMAEAKLVRDFMVRTPVCASLWQPLSLIRQTMLTNSFSYLPVLDDRTKDKPRWMLVSDRAMARYLRVSQEERGRRLAKTLCEVISDTGPEPELKLEEAHKVRPTEEIHAVFKSQDNGRPVLVFDDQDDGTRPLLGIVMPFDIL